MKYGFLKIAFFILIFIYIIFSHNKKNKFKNILLETFSNFNIAELKDEKERKLFITNLTEFYLYYRKKYLLKYKILYNESDLLTFQDKLNYLAIHESPQYKSIIVDKIRLHDYSKKILGKDICVPILKIYNNIENIDFNHLPDKFVMKYNHGSGMNIICDDKAKFDIENAKKKLYIWKNINYGLLTAEFQYMFVKKRILVEKLLEKNLIDYKIYCFNGNPEFILTKKKYNNTIIKNYYNLEWKCIILEQDSNNFNQIYKIPKPKNLSLMIKYAKLLSQEFVFVRVDLYEINNQVFLGELTFTPCNGFKTWINMNTTIRLGKLLNIKRIRNYLFNK